MIEREQSNKGEVPRVIAVSAPVNARRYELWRTPQVKPGWHLYGYQDDVEISRKPLESETRGDRIRAESGGAFGMKHKPEEYRYIRAWGRLMHSGGYYIRDQQAQAAEDDAPLDAVFQKTGYDDQGEPLPRRWTCYSDVNAPDIRYVMDGLLKEPEA